MKSAAVFGFSKILSRYSLTTNSLEAANQAVKLTPNDAEAHRARAVVLNNSGMKEDAAKEMERAVSLRPRDDLLWMEVGILRDGYGESGSALAAFDQSIRCAPYYGHPRWQRGNLLVRLGRYDEGIQRVAFGSNQQPGPVARIDRSGLGHIAWRCPLTEQLSSLKTTERAWPWHEFFAQHGKTAEALQQFRKISTTLRKMHVLISFVQ
jgi:tetratricopeptide (TPR) repeat protein